MVAGSGRVVVAVPLLLLCLYTFWCPVFYFLASAASPSTCDMCIRFRGCPVMLDIGLSVSARGQKTHVLCCCARGVSSAALLQQRAA